MGTKVLNFSQYKKIPKFIAVEGPIGVGKTTLAKLLAESFGYNTFLEKPNENPFLEDFYQMREILLKRALSYEDITFSYAKELKVEKDFLLHCLVKSKNAKEVIKCMSKKV